MIYGPVGGGTPTFLGPAPQAQHSGFGVQATGNISGWDPTNPNLGGLTSIISPDGIPDPSVRSYFLGIQRAIRRDLTLEANYVGTSASHLMRAENVNRIPGGLLPEGACVKDNLGRLLCSQRDSGLNQYGEPNNPVRRTEPKFRRSAGMARYRRIKLQLAATFASGEAGRRTTAFH